MTDKCLDFFEELYSNCGEVKRDGEQISEGNGNGSDFRAGISKTDETILPDTQPES